MVAGPVMVMLPPPSAWPRVSASAGSGSHRFPPPSLLPPRSLRTRVPAKPLRWKVLALPAPPAPAVSAAPASALTFQAHRDVSAGSSSSPRQVVVADLKGDGFADLATANAGSDGVAVLLNDGTATATSVGFSPARQYPTGSSPYGVTTGDVNGDHLADLVAANEGANTVSVLLGKGAGTFVAQPPIALGSGGGRGPATPSTPTSTATRKTTVPPRTRTMTPSLCCSTRRVRGRGRVPAR